MSIIYQGPLANTLKRLKRFSLTATFATFFSPLLIEASNPSIPFGAKVVLVSAVIGTSVSSTGLISYFMGPYVNSIQLKKEVTEESSNPQIELERINLLGMSVKDKILVNDLKKIDSMRPFVNYEAKKRKYFIHEELIKDDKIRETLNKMSI